MLMKNAVAALLGLTLAAEAASVHHYRSPAEGGLVRRQNKQNGGNRGGNRGGNAGGGGGNQNNQDNQAGNNQGGNNQAASVTCLAANAIQTGSQQTGQNGQVADGQVEAAMYAMPFVVDAGMHLLTLCIVTLPTSSTSVLERTSPTASRSVVVLAMVLVCAKRRK